MNDTASRCGDREPMFVMTLMRSPSLKTQSRERRLGFQSGVMWSNKELILQQ
jgi:hypothetical protein